MSPLSSPQIALFGTSADPPTIGHQKILTWLSQTFDLVRVWASDNPFKHHPVNLDHRTAMLRLCLQEIQLAPSAASPALAAHNLAPHNLEVDSSLSSPRSLITVERARRRWPTASFTLVVGSDLVAQIASWYQAEELLDAVKLLIIPRPGFPLEEQAQAEALSWLRDRTTVTIAPIEGPAVSSTQYRQGNQRAVSPNVQAYIQREHLYSDLNPVPPNPVPSAP